MNEGENLARSTWNPRPRAFEVYSPGVIGVGEAVAVQKSSSLRVVVRRPGVNLKCLGLTLSLVGVNDWSTLKARRLK
ncbi:hypothetical protein GIB67_038392 [Kingdonia uniflora]|uniref:Uncharacterized protein n=1 Tax=Kingdonia uniflora TaxID=39325 RepID=A0A7J7NNX9_9MAGN|nr:hypothetical protein GIB67_038392 [Kingdonia uniflora]